VRTRTVPKTNYGFLEDMAPFEQSYGGEATRVLPSGVEVTTSKFTQQDGVGDILKSICPVCSHLLNPSSRD
jgi:hypothetical protein